MSVVEIDEVGVIYTVSLAVQHFRRQKESSHGVKGRSELYLCRSLIVR